MLRRDCKERAVLPSQPVQQEEKEKLSIDMSINTQYGKIVTATALMRGQPSLHVGRYVSAPWAVGWCQLHKARSAQGTVLGEPLLLARVLSLSV